MAGPIEQGVRQIFQQVGEANATALLDQFKLDDADGPTHLCTRWLPARARDSHRHRSRATLRKLGCSGRIRFAETRNAGADDEGNPIEPGNAGRTLSALTCCTLDVLTRIRVSNGLPVAAQRLDEVHADIETSQAQLQFAPAGIERPACHIDDCGKIHHAFQVLVARHPV